jgi:hypothetical protein
MGEESERREEVEHRVEPARPLGGHAPHVPAGVAQSVAGSASAPDVEEFLRVIEPIDVVAELGKEMRVAALTTRHIENARAVRQSEELDEACHFLPVALEREEWAVLEEIVGVEC